MRNLIGVVAAIGCCVVWPAEDGGEELLRVTFDEASSLLVEGLKQMGITPSTNAVTREELERLWAADGISTAEAERTVDEWLEEPVLQGMEEGDRLRLIRLFMQYLRGSSVHDFSEELRRTEEKLLEPAVFRPVAERLALYCQSDPGLFPDYLSGAWLPRGIDALGVSHARVFRKGADVEMGGGFYHFGYLLTLQSVEGGTNHWHLSLYREQSVSTNLTVVQLPADRSLSADEVYELVCTGHDRRIQAAPTQPAAWQGKAQFIMGRKRWDDAVRVAEEWVNAVPEDWLGRFTLAHLRARQGELIRGADDFAAWVEAKPTFVRCIYLFLFDLREGRSGPALDAVRRSLDQPFVELPGERGSKFYLGFQGAVYAFEQRDWRLCHQLTDKMLTDGRLPRERSWHRDLLRIRAALWAVDANWDNALADMRSAAGLRERSRFGEDTERTEDEALQAAVERRDKDWIMDDRNWRGGRFKWFSPYETDDTGIHGARGVPNPYP
ncbi:MAG: hypothetical protein KDM81_04755 [Verrucomicrobiae bacterium]|nr:hypothetical protein [Verrucomicrobiae bacterium]